MASKKLAKSENHASGSTLLGFPPFRMKAQMAAYYCCMSITQFYKAVEQNEFPEGRKTTGGRYWLRSDLEEAMAEKSNVIDHDFSQPI